MSHETSDDVGAFLDGAIKGSLVCVYASIAWAAASEPRSPWLVTFIVVTSGLIAVAARRRRTRGG